MSELFFVDLHAVHASSPPAINISIPPTDPLVFEYVAEVVKGKIF